MNNSKLINELRSSQLFDNSTLGNRAADALEASQPALCCGEYAKCSRPCTPRGEWLAKERIKNETIDPVLWQFKDSETGKWCNFMDEKLRQNTIEDGRWEIRALYTHPSPQPENGTAKPKNTAIRMRKSMLGGKQREL